MSINPNVTAQDLINLRILAEEQRIKQQFLNKIRISEETHE